MDNQVAIIRRRTLLGDTLGGCSLRLKICVLEIAHDGVSHFIYYIKNVLDNLFIIIVCELIEIIDF